MKKIISRDNSEILDENDNQNDRCNCRVRTRCPLKGNCLIENVIYKAGDKNEENNNND